MREQRKSTQNSAHTEVPVNVITCGGKKAVGKHIANPQGLMKTPSPFLFLVMALEIINMPLPHLFLPLSLQGKEVAISVSLDSEACAFQDSSTSGLLR